MKINITSKQLDAELPDLLRVADEIRTAGLRGATRYARARGVADLREVARLVARDGLESGATLTKASTAIVGVERGAQLRDDIIAITRNPKVEPDTVAAGRVLAPRTQVLKGMRVTLSTDAGAQFADGRVEDTGHYVIVMPRADFDKLLGTTRFITFTLLDANRKQLRESRVPSQPGVRQTLAVNFELKLPSSATTGPIPPNRGGVPQNSVDDTRPDQPPTIGPTRKRPTKRKPSR